MLEQTHRRFMFGSTSKRSFKPIPQGLPGVASSMKRPNSGWKMGNGSTSLPTISEYLLIQEYILYFITKWGSGTHPPCLHRASSFANASRISAWRRESLTFRLSSWKATTRYSTYNRVNRMSPRGVKLRYLVSPQQHIPFFSLRPVPDSKELLLFRWASKDIGAIWAISLHLNSPFSNMVRILLSFRPF